MGTDAGLGHVWRECAPDVLAAVARRCGDFGEAEDAVQDAVLAAARQWPADGVPDNPRGWLITVASRRLVDRGRSDRARTARERLAAGRTPTGERAAPAADEATGADRDDSLALILLCCHPVLPVPAQVGLTLRAVAGLSTAQVARALLVPEPTMAQRISRAKARLRESGARFVLPAVDELEGRVRAAAQVLYLAFTEGHTSSTGGGLLDVVLADEAIRLTRRLAVCVPDDDEVQGLLALMLLTDARRPARLAADGSLVPLAEQDRTLWQAAMVDEGVAILERVLPRGPVGVFQLQAAIAAVHAEASSAQETDWAQVEALYDMLGALDPGPVVRLNRAVAVAMVHGPAAGLDLLAPLLSDRRMARHHRLHAVRAHLLDLDGRAAEAAEAWVLAARLATSIPEQRYLNARARRGGVGSDKLT